MIQHPTGFNRGGMGAAYVQHGTTFQRFGVAWQELGTACTCAPDISTRAHLSQGEGRAQIVVEPKQELPFELARGSQGGAAEGVAGNRHKTDWPSHFVKVRY